MGYEILSLGNPIVDIILQVPEEYLSSVSGKKGGQEAVDYETFCKIIEGSQASPYMVPGGSATNTIKCLANFGQKCAFIGKTGNDDFASFFSQSLVDIGVVPLLLQSETPTGRSVCLVTPDGERSMRTFLGACVEMKPGDLEAKHFSGVSLLHIEGYALYNIPLVLHAMELAKKLGAKISLDLASFEIVELFKDKLWEILHKYVDIVFANELEAKALTGLDEESTCDRLAEICDIVVILMGRDGCWVRRREKKVHCQAYPVTPLDSTGAGDAFAGGFLHGYLEGRSLEASAHYGALLGAEVVQVLGAEIPQKVWKDLKPVIVT
uniref:Sugar kinase n=1 Tax=uncultured bacterium W5-77b TaxID=1131000 RepID=H9BWG0_9BACT|nr:sugar kinase [uncultured bacterium W5-77b]